MAREQPLNDFGLLIAYVLPGIVTIWGVSATLSPASHLLWATVDGEVTIAGFLSTTVAAVGVGLTLSTIRWLVVDTVHRLTGLPAPKFNFRKLGNNDAAFGRLVDVHYRYYQFYGNSLIALVAITVCRHIGMVPVWYATDWLDLAAVLLGSIFFAASRDTLGKYYDRTEQLLGRGSS